MFFMKNDLISSNKFRFNTCGFCINHLLHITHKIYKSFDDDCETQGELID